MGGREEWMREGKKDNMACCHWTSSWPRYPSFIFQKRSDIQIISDNSNLDIISFYSLFFLKRGSVASDGWNQHMDFFSFFFFLSCIVHVASFMLRRWCPHARSLTLLGQVCHASMLIMALNSWHGAQLASWGQTRKGCGSERMVIVEMENGGEEGDG